MFKPNASLAQFSTEQLEEELKRRKIIALRQTVNDAMAALQALGAYDASMSAVNEAIPDVAQIPAKLRGAEADTMRSKVLALKAKSKSVDQIAQTLGLSVPRTKHYLYYKLK